nr:LysR family transcriptional regulator substrate-binding protein [Lactobacillus amylolyticus]
MRNFGTTEFLQAVAEFSKTYPDVRIKITSGGHEQLYQALKDNKIDFAFSDLRRTPSNLYMNDFLTSSDYKVIISQGTFAADKEKVESTELEDLPCILIVGANEAAMMVASRQGYLLMNNRTSKNPGVANLDLVQQS